MLDFYEASPEKLAYIRTQAGDVILDDKNNYQAEAGQNEIVAVVGVTNPTKWELDDIPLPVLGGVAVAASFAIIWWLTGHK